MKVGFFEEAEGVRSSTRLISFLCFFFTVGFDFLWIKGHDITDNFLIINLIFFTAVFAPKTIAKLAELKFEKLNDKK